MKNNKVLVGNGDSYLEDSRNVIFEDASTFSQYIEKRSVEENVPCMTLILDFCERRSLDVDDITALISKPMREKIKAEMISAGLMKRTEASLDGLDG